MKLACVQTDVVYGDVGENVRRAAGRLPLLKEQGVELAVFPEAYLTGYCFPSRDEAIRCAVAIDAKDSSKLDSRLFPLQTACQDLGIHVIIGFAGWNLAELSNSAYLLCPEGSVYRYDKTHLPELGLDKYVRPGDRLEVFDTELGKIAICICFDLRHPEVARTLALKGAELIVLPTNWPLGAELSPNSLCAARAGENRVFFAACNRVGVENGFRFIGKSRIIDPSGKILAEARDGQETLICDLDLSEARRKRNVIIPGEYETTVFESRRPELYGRLTEAADESEGRRDADPTSSAR